MLTSEKLSQKLSSKHLDFNPPARYILNCLKILGDFFILKWYFYQIRWCLIFIITSSEFKFIGHYIYYKLVCGSPVDFNLSKSFKSAGVLFWHQKEFPKKITQHKGSFIMFKVNLNGNGLVCFKIYKIFWQYFVHWKDEQKRWKLYK